MTDSPVTVTLQQQYRGWPLQLTGAVDLDTIPELVHQFFKLHDLVDTFEKSVSNEPQPNMLTQNGWTPDLSADFVGSEKTVNKK